MPQDNHPIHVRGQVRKASWQSKSQQGDVMARESLQLSPGEGQGRGSEVQHSSHGRRRDPWRLSPDLMQGHCYLAAEVAPVSLRRERNGMGWGEAAKLVAELDCHTRAPAVSLLFLSQIRRKNPFLQLAMFPETVLSFAQHLLII